VVKLLVQILDPKPRESVYDPACGSGGMLIESVRHMKNDSLCCGNIFGQEKNVTNAAIAKMNLFLHGASDFNILQGDTLREPKILQGGTVAKFDCVIANPPFSLKRWGETEWRNDKYGRNIWGTPSDKVGADFAWIQHMVQSMKPGTGRMAVVMPQGVLFRGNEEGEMRKKMVLTDMLEAVITLGEKLFFGTGLSPCILIFRRVKPQDHSSRVLMVDASKILTVKRAQNELSPENVQEIYQHYLDYADKEDVSRVVTLQEIEEKDFVLAPNRYVHYHQEEQESYDSVKARFDSAVKAVREAEEAFNRLMAQ
jgi:type I restriction enzyme M protein